jgi:hypothetical protein
MKRVGLFIVVASASAQAQAGDFDVSRLIPSPMPLALFQPPPPPAFEPAASEQAAQQGAAALLIERGAHRPHAVRSESTPPSRCDASKAKGLKPNIPQ